jgi:divalent metal cation (Fe/Co/Zn/Cd) transporter
VEFGVAVGAGIAASSVALIAFGLDSLVECLAALVVIWRFRHTVASEEAERRAQRLIALSFLVLGLYITAESIRSLVGGEQPGVSWIGIGLAAVTAPTMPLLARAKRRVGSALGSGATVSEGTQNLLCAYLSVALLLGLGANAVFGWWWADPVAGLVIAGVAFREGLEGWRGDRSCCDCTRPDELTAG